MSKHCTVDNCRKVFYSIGLCEMHYKRYRKHGDVHAIGKGGPPLQDHHVGKYVAIRRNGSSDRDHRRIAEEALGRTLPPGVEVHHVDGCGRNNTNTNLVICQDRAYHFLLEKRTRIFAAGGDPDKDLLCRKCGPVPREKFTVRRSGEPVTICRTCNSAEMKLWKARRNPQ